MLRTHVGGRTDARYHVGWREDGLFNVLEVVVWLFTMSTPSSSHEKLPISYVLVQSQTSDSPQWIIVMRPREGTMENIDRSVLYFPRLHDVHRKKPRGEVTLLDLVEEIFDMVVSFGACQLLDGLAVHCLDTSFGEEMPFDVDKAPVLVLSANTDEPCKVWTTYLFVQSVRVHTKSIDMRQRGRNTTRANEMHQSMNPLRGINMIVPEHIVLRHIHSRVSLVTTIHARKLDRVPHEEDR